MNYFTAFYILSLVVTYYFTQGCVLEDLITEENIIFEEQMKHFVGPFNYIIDESNGEMALKNGTLDSTYDSPNIWMYRKYLSKEIYRNSVLSFGKEKYLAKMKTHLTNKVSDSFTMITLGGSISCAHHGNKGKWRPDNTGNLLSNAWPSLLEVMFKNKFNESNIKMHNLCIRGVGTNVWVDKLMEWKSDTKHIIQSADLVFVETAINDIHNFNSEDRYGM